MTKTQPAQLIEEIKIIQNPNRKRTIDARLTNGVLLVNAPVGVPDKELDKIISKLKERLLKKSSKEN
jgi:hypothetical protein